MNTVTPTELLIAVYILWDIAKKFFSSKNSDLEKNTAATLSNTLSIQRLEDKLETLLGIPKDVNEAHTKIRVLDERLKNHMENPISS